MMSRSSTAILALVLLTANAGAQEPLPERCAPALIVETMGQVEKRCPNLRITFEGHEMAATIRKRYDDAACFSAARSYVADEVRAMPNAWCTAAEYKLNGNATPLVARRR
ncbi:MAG: hypothetical protein F9K29_03400 [Hyphomicrobiaceae bacterium]|nr:MAG: hypothetical protein F9K29_03400 [Hyphomicrobiaceae bacterium]